MSGPRCGRRCGNSPRTIALLRHPVAVLRWRQEEQRKQAMAIDPLGNRTLQALQRALSGLSLRQQALSNNIVNVETPRYTALEVNFEDVLRRAVEPARGPALLVSHPAHLRDLPPSPTSARPLVLLSSAPARNDGNNVDIEREMASLAETQITFQALAQMTSTRLAVLRSAVTDTR